MSWEACSMLPVLFWLLVAHAAADFALQPDAMAKGKNRHYRTAPPPNAQYTPCWPYWLTAHALVHGGAVALVTGLWWLGLAEAVVHWACDFGKCENWYGVHTDQAVHLSTKLIWAVVAG